jgi:7,8-dihydro-6-hydroxymethylpterin-pyrophosphokinase
MNKIKAFTKIKFLLTNITKQESLKIFKAKTKILKMKSISKVFHNKNLNFTRQTNFINQNLII